MSGFSADNRVSCSLSGALRRIKLCTYCRSKSWAQGALDLALIMVNITHLTGVLRRGPSHQHLFVMTVVIIVASLILEIIIAAILCAKERFDLDDPNQQRTMDVMNNILMWAIFASSVIHVFIAVVVDNHHVHRQLPASLTSTLTNCNNSSPRE